VQVIAWRTVSEMTYNVSSETLNLSHLLAVSLTPLALKLDFVFSRVSGSTAYCKLVIAMIRNEIGLN